MGYNALPALPNADPVVGDLVLVEIAGATQLSDLSSAADAAFTPFARLVLPFRGLAALEIEATPIEVWRVSPETQQRIGALASAGVELGDLRLGARFTLLEEGANWPALGFRLVVKTTTGKGFENRRFIDAPAYVFDALFAKDLARGVGPIDRLRVLAKAGFMAWQQGSDWQDDAADLGLTLQLRSGRARVELEWRGYFGYEAQDRPHLLGFTFGYTTGHFEWVATVNRGLSADAPPWELRAGVVVRFEGPWSARPPAESGAPPIAPAQVPVPFEEPVTAEEPRGAPLDP